MLSRMRNISGHTDTLMAVGVFGLILLLIVPLPPIVLDMFLCFSIVLSIISLLLTLYIENALEFNAFPSLLLFLTLYRLGLNIASTRMILTRAEGGDIIQTFGEFVTQGNTFVGLVLFVLLTLVNFIVVTKGAGRIAEVAARFTLEALPGRQMAIDSDIAAGLLPQEEGRKAREKIAKEADFYGSMDGASKFVRGDAIAGLVITFVNILGGFIVGLTAKGFSLVECWTTFTRLTIGDGLVSQIPGLLISVAAGIMVTRASSGSLSKSLPKQIFHHPKVLMLTALALFALSAIPGMPFFLMAPMALGLLLYALFQSKKQSQKTEKEEIEEEPSFLFVPPLEIQVGYQLIGLTKPLHQKLAQIRKKLSQQIGFRAPAVRISDNLDLSPSGWTIKLKGVVIRSGRDADLAQLVRELTNVVELHAHELIHRQDISEMIQQAKEFDSAVIDELIPKKLSLGQILKVLQNLLRERVPIKDFVTILEVLADQTIGKDVDTDVLTEAVRQKLSRGISETFFGKKNSGRVITVDPKVEQTISVAHGQIRLSVIEKLTSEMIKLIQIAKQEGVDPIVVTSISSRSHLKRLIEKRLPEVSVLSYQEIISEIKLCPIGSISNEVLM